MRGRPCTACARAVSAVKARAKQSARARRRRPIPKEIPQARWFCLVDLYALTTARPRRETSRRHGHPDTADRQPALALRAQGPCLPASEGPGVRKSVVEGKDV